MNKIHQDKHIQFFVRAFYHFVPMAELLDIGITTETSIQSTHQFSNSTYGSTEYVSIYLNRTINKVMSNDIIYLETVGIKFHTNTGNLKYKPFFYHEEGDEVLNPTQPLGKYIRSKEKLLKEVWNLRIILSNTNISNLDEVVKNYGIL